MLPRNAESKVILNKKKEEEYTCSNTRLCILQFTHDHFRALALAKCSKVIMGELQYAQTSGATRIFFYVQIFIGNRTNGEESFDSYPPSGLTWTGTAS